MKSAKKIITLDGDMGERTYSFLEQLGTPLNINNTCIFNTSNIKIIAEKEEFQHMIINDIRDGKKLFIPSMSNDFVTSLEHTLKNEFPDKSESIKIYNSFQADNIKEYDMKNILEEWSKLDCVLSTPTIEAGVSYDCERFDKIYGVISDGSCSQRSYCQMMARI